MKKLQPRVERKKEIYREVKFFEQDLSCTTPWFYDTVVEDREELQKKTISVQE
ncbi:hypothetical protein [Aliarcobacter butzleri]|uniref:hypothetical protein n=1 Tax=Aliarcobacter butzleri TaxID=28197 RepID=UPI002B24F80E|nr:hypothetical protein [Aliarcobacter butzleri]